MISKAPVDGQGKGCECDVHRKTALRARRLTKTEEKESINRSDRSTHPKEKSVLTSGSVHY